MIKIHVFDLDNTITRVDTFKLFIFFYVIKKPHLYFSFFIFILHVPFSLFGFKNGTWLKEKFVKKCLKNEKRETIENECKKFSIIIFKYFLNNKTRKLLRYLSNEQDNFLLIISASFDIYVKKLGKLIGFQDGNIFGTELEFNNDKLTGRIVGNNLFGIHKVKKYENWMLKRKIKKYEVYFYSDHHRDIPFFEIAHHEILVNPTAKLIEKYSNTKHIIL